MIVLCFLTSSVISSNYLVVFFYLNAWDASSQLTAFGGDRVRSLYRSIERHHSRFKCPPIGPIGYHVVWHNYTDCCLLITKTAHYGLHFFMLLILMQQLASNCWSLAVDCALGRLLDAFIVSCHKDSLVLRECAKEVKYHNLQIIIYDFSKPR